MDNNLKVKIYADGAVLEDMLSAYKVGLCHVCQRSG